MAWEEGEPGNEANILIIILPESLIHNQLIINLVLRHSERRIKSLQNSTPSKGSINLYVKVALQDYNKGNILYTYYIILYPIYPVYILHYYKSN